MAQRRMFSKRIINSAKFLKMPSSTQCLYFHLGLNADDDGVVEAYTVLQSIHASEDDLRVLVAKGYVAVLNEDLVVYICDWNENNRIRADRKIDSIYKDLLLQMLPDVEIKERKMRADVAKKLLALPVENDEKNDGQPMDVQWTAQDSIGKDRTVEVNLGQSNMDGASDEAALRTTKKTSKAKTYSDDEELNEAIKNFIEFRKKIKKPMTDHAVDLLIANLNKLSNYIPEQIEIINQSILNGWQGIFPLKDQQQTINRQPAYGKQSKAEELYEFYDMAREWSQQ